MGVSMHYTQREKFVCQQFLVNAEEQIFRLSLLHSSIFLIGVLSILMLISEPEILFIIGFEPNNKISVFITFKLSLLILFILI